jgi:hypothetical protein
MPRKALLPALARDFGVGAATIGTTRKLFGMAL